MIFNTDRSQLPPNQSANPIDTVLLLRIEQLRRNRRMMMGIWGSKKSMRHIKGFAQLLSSSVHFVPSKTRFWVHNDSRPTVQTCNCARDTAGLFRSTFISVNTIEKNLLKALIETSQWEWIELPVFRTQLGRHVYLCIANEVLQGREIRMDQPLKRVLFHPTFTHRAIRLKLREFEQGGYIQMQFNPRDRRLRSLVPTPALLDVIEKHANVLLRAIEKTTFCFVK